VAIDVDDCFMTAGGIRTSNNQRPHTVCVIDGKIAIFTTCEEAQRAADTHLRDGYPNSDIIDDGFSWLA
jgi:hypothetical protein